MSLCHFLLVVVVAVEGPHEPIILEELHALPLLIHIIQDQLALDQHLLLLEAVAIGPAYKLLCIPTVASLEDEPIQCLFISDAH
jgi:hypothetical protein